MTGEKPDLNQVQKLGRVKNFEAVTRLQKDSHFPVKMGVQKREPLWRGGPLQRPQQWFFRVLPKSPEAYCWDHLGVSEESACTRERSLQIWGESTDGYWTRNAPKGLSTPSKRCGFRRDFAQNFALYRTSKIKVWQTMLKNHSKYPKV